MLTRTHTHMLQNPIHLSSGTEVNGYEAPTTWGRNRRSTFQGGISLPLRSQEASVSLSLDTDCCMGFLAGQNLPQLRVRPNSCFTISLSWHFHHYSRSSYCNYLVLSLKSVYFQCTDCPRLEPRQHEPTPLLLMGREERKRVSGGL